MRSYSNLHRDAAFKVGFFHNLLSRPAARIAQLLGAHWLGVSHNHCAKCRRSRSRLARHSPSKTSTWIQTVVADF